MSYKEYKPSDRLRKHIKCFWIMEREYSSEIYKGDTEYLWPTGLTEILYVDGPNFKQVDKQNEALLPNEIVIGAYNKRFVLKNNGHVRIVGIRCFNHGANILFGIDLSKVRNSIIEYRLKNIDGDILASGDNEAVIRYLDEYCEGRLSTHEDQLVDILYSLYKEPDKSLEQLASEANLSLRQFERKVKQMTSFTPKELATIIRFDKARVKMLFNKDYLQVMNDLGYYDYSHFCRDFKRFFDMTPKQFVDFYKRSFK